MEGEDAILACIGNRSKRRFGYASFIEWHKTSFYIKSQYPPLQTTKVSIHGPDPRPQHVGKQHFRLDLDRDQAVKSALAAGGGWGSDPGFEPPLVFSGRSIHDDASHIVRFSAEWSMFVKNIPSAPTPKLDRRATLNTIVAAPPPGRVTHIDLYVSNQVPYWPDEAKVRARNAGVGPIVNDANMYLTGVVSQEAVAYEPDPFGDLVGSTPLKDCVRGVAAGVDATGLLWLTEKMLPRTFVAADKRIRRRR
jgi:hypothetical protein